MDDINKILDKIKNQSTLIIIVLLLYSYFALRGTVTFTSPIVVSGFVTIIIAGLLAIFNFFTFQISEGYKNIIEELKGVINTLKSQQRFTDKRYKELTTDTSRQTKEEITGGYTSMQDDQTPNI